MRVATSACSYKPSQLLDRDGAHIAIVKLNDQKMSAVAEEVKALGMKATTFKVDVTKRDEVNAAIDHAETSVGGFIPIQGLQWRARPTERSGAGTDCSSAEGR